MGERLRKALIESKENYNESKSSKMLKRLHSLDEIIDDFIDELEDEICKTEDNPMFVKKCNELLANLSKEHNEFFGALRSVVSAVDRKSKIVPFFKKMESKVRDVRSNSSENLPEE